MFAADAVTDAITLDSFLVLTVISFVIPTLVGLITKASASPAVKQIVNLVLSAVAGVIVTATQLDGTAVISKEAAMNAALALGISIVSYLGIYRPHDANQALSPTVSGG